MSCSLYAAVLVRLLWPINSLRAPIWLASVTWSAQPSAKPVPDIWGNAMTAGVTR
jgi:hypothetical protein